MSMNWLEGMPPQMADPMTEQMGTPMMKEQMGGPMAEQMGGPMTEQMGGPMTEQMGGPMTEHMGRPMAMPVFAGQKLIVVGGSSGMGRQTAADVVAAGGSAVVRPPRGCRLGPCSGGTSGPAIGAGIASRVVSSGSAARASWLRYYCRTQAPRSARQIGPEPDYIGQDLNVIADQLIYEYGSGAGQ